jgi:ribosomal protein S18 acetylase RimI-like enzyme
MTGFWIRSFTHADEPFLWEILYHTLYVPQGHAPFPREIVKEPEIAKYVLGWGKEDDRGMIALDEISSKPIGAAWFRLFRFDNKGYGYVDDNTPELSIALLPGYRNRGIGTALLNRLLEEAGQHYAAVSLSVSPANQALHLYQRLGFEIVGQQGASIIMRREFDKRVRGDSS